MKTKRLTASQRDILFRLNVKYPYLYLRTDFSRGHKGFASDFNEYGTAGLSPLPIKTLITEGLIEFVKEIKNWEDSEKWGIGHTLYFQISAAGKAKLEMEAINNHAMLR